MVVTPPRAIGKPGPDTYFGDYAVYQEFTGKMPGWRFSLSQFRESDKLIPGNI
jgi:hypothetical protein